jgi:DNA-binding beta-propeller fold protein YncE
MANQATAPRQRRNTVAGSDCNQRRRLLPRALLSLLWLAAPIAGHAMDCNRAMQSPVTDVTLPGSPFTALPSADGCWLFVSLSHESGADRAGLAVLHRVDGAVTVQRTVRVTGTPAGMTLTHDGTLLIVANGPGVLFFDVERLKTAGSEALIGAWRQVGHAWPTSIYVAVTADDHYLLVSNETAGTVSVIDLAQTRRSRFAQIRVVGSIPVGDFPVGMVLSSDDRFLFATAQSVTDAGWPKQCQRESGSTGTADHPMGAIVVIDMARAASDPGKSVLRRVPAGCNPVRVVASQTGRVYVTARGSNALLAFTERELTGTGPDPKATEVAVGTSPVGVALIDGGRQIVVANSDRFNTGAAAPSLYVMASAGVGVSSTPAFGMMPTQGFPREIRATADGHSLLVTNFSTGTLQIVDLERALWDFVWSKGQRSDRFPESDFSATLGSNLTVPRLHRRKFDRPTGATRRREAA